MEVEVEISGRRASIALNRPEKLNLHGFRPLPRLVGKGRAMSLILTGRRLTAGEALAIGLVDHVVDAARFEDELAALVDVYAAAPRAAAAASKRLVARSYEAGFEDALRESEALLAECLTAPEVERARAAWRDR